MCQGECRGSCVEAEDRRRDGKVVMELTSKARRGVFGDRLPALNPGNRKDDSLLGKKIIFNNIKLYIRKKYIMH